MALTIMTLSNIGTAYSCITCGQLLHGGSLMQLNPTSKGLSIPCKTNNRIITEIPKLFFSVFFHTLPHKLNIHGKITYWRTIDQIN